MTEKQYKAMKGGIHAHAHAHTNLNVELWDVGKCPFCDCWVNLLKSGIYQCIGNKSHVGGFNYMTGYLEMVNEGLPLDKQVIEAVLVHIKDSKDAICTICGSPAAWMPWGMYECMADDSHVWDGKSELFQDVKDLNEGSKTALQASLVNSAAMGGKSMKHAVDAGWESFEGVHKVDASGLVKALGENNVAPKFIFHSLTNPCLEFPLTPLPLPVDSITVKMEIKTVPIVVKEKKYPLPLRSPKSEWGWKMREILDNKKY